MGTTNKSEIIDMVSSEVNMSKKAVGEVLDSFLDNLVSSLGKGHTVAFKGFGTFGVTQRAARMGVNPQTREPLHIPARNSPTFKSSKRLKDAVQ